MSRNCLLSVAVLSSVFVATLAYANPSEIDLGRDRAIESCSGCHEVTAQQPRPAPVPFPEENALVVTPTFEAISIKYKGHEKELRDFILAPDHPMKEQKFLPSDLDAIIAYIKKAKHLWHQFKQH